MKKLLNKRGSVLFLVVVVMALLLIAASATYYVIRNQHASANTHYNSEQSYQTAYSVSDTISTYFANVLDKISKNPDVYTDSIFEAMMDMHEGDVLTPGHNDFTKYGLGEYDVSIARIPSPEPDSEGTEAAYFEITTTAEVNGETTTLVQVWKITLTASETKYFSKFLTSTGYREGDGLMVANSIYGDTYFENPFTRAGVGAYQRSVYSCGTLADDGLHFMEVAQWKDLEVVVSDHYYIDTSAGGGQIQIGGLYVGGNLVDGTLNNGGKALLVENLFVLNDLTLNVGGHAGNFYVQGDCYVNSNIQTNINGSRAYTNFYINGDLYLNNVVKPNPDDNATIFLDSARFYVNGDVYFQNKGVGDIGALEYYGTCYNETSGVMSDAQIESMTTKVTEADGFVIEDEMDASTSSKFSNWAQVGMYISNRTARGTYGAWNAKSLVPNTAPIVLDDYTIYSVNEHGWIHDTPAPPEGSEILGIVYQGNPAVRKTEQYNDCYYITVDDNCTLKSATSWTGNGIYYIVVDATEKDITVKLDPPDDSDTFMFGEAVNNGVPSGYAASNVNILVKGSHAVVFVLDDDTDFVFGSGSFIGHLDVALKLTGKTTVEDMYAAKINVATYLNDPAKTDTLRGYLDDKKLTGEIDDMTGKDKVIYVFDRSKFPTTATPHNNIFFVANDECSLNFSANDSTFCGYIYAPKCILEVNNMSKGLGFLGGLIVGSYSYYGYTAILVFTDPYEEGGRGSSIVSDLISKANGTPNPGDGGSEKSTNFGLELLGYK